MKTQWISMTIASWLWLTAAVATPQDPGTASPAAGFTERIDVELVNVDVWVGDRSGEPVAGLEVADFAILHDGVEVPITHFTEIRDGAAHRRPIGSGETPAAGAASVDGPAAPVPGHVVVYFDQSRLHPRNVPALIRGLEEFLEAGQVEPERVLVLRQLQGLAVEAPFGSSRAELAAALARLARGAPGGLVLEAETEQALQAIRDSWEQIQDTVGSAVGGLAAVPGASDPGGSGTGTGGPRAVVGGVGSGAGPDACGMFPGQVQPILDGFARSHARRVTVTLSNLFDTAGFLAGLPGVKTLLYLSDGLDTRPGSALATYAGSLCPAGAAELLSGALSAELSGSFLDLTRHANANRVTIHALQASGLTSPEVASASRGRRARREGFGSRGAFESSRRAAERSGLGLIAAETGGRTVFNQNEFGAGLIRIGEDLRSYYSLAYRPPAGDGKDREHRIEVRLSDGSLSARYRRGYVEKDDRQWLTERIEGALNLGITSNPLGIRLGAGDLRDVGDGTSRLPLYVMVPVERLAFLPDQETFVAEVTVRALVRGVASGALSMYDQSFRVRGSPGIAGWANLALELTLDEGAHVSAVGVRDEGTGEASFISTTLEVGSGG